MSRRFQFSLRALLVALTATCLWFGWRVGQERRQREAVEAVKAAGGDVLYDWEVAVADWTSAEGFVLLPEAAESPRRAWPRNLLADDFFHDVTTVLLYTDGEPAEALIVRLRDLPKLQVLYLPESFGTEVERTIAEALPHCRIVRQRVEKGTLLSRSTQSPENLASGSATSSPERIEVLELQGFDGTTPRAAK